MSKWEISQRDILRAAGWEIFHVIDEKYCAVHNATGRIATIWIDTEKYIYPRFGETEDFNIFAEYVADQLLDCLSERHDHDKWLLKMDQEDDQ